MSTYDHTAFQCEVWSPRSSLCPSHGPSRASLQEAGATGLAWEGAVLDEQ